MAVPTARRGEPTGMPLRLFASRWLLVLGLAACSSGQSGKPAPPTPSGIRPDEPTTITVQPRLTMTVAQYAAGESRYALNRVDTLTVQYPNSAQTQVVEWSAWVRLNVALGPSPAQVVITLDSMRARTLPRDSLVLADGAQWTGSLVEGRRLEGLEPANPSTIAGQLVSGSLAELLTPLPVGGARGGFSWRDTVQVTERVAGAAIPVTAMRDVTADVVQQPAPGLRIGSRATLDGKGVATRFGGDIGVSLSGSRYRTRHLTQAGQVLSVEGRDSVALVLDVSSVGQTVPATQTGHLTIERIAGPR